MHRRAFLERSTRAALALGVLRHVAACRAESRPSAADAGFVDLRDQYFLKFLQQNPVISTYFGGDGYTPVLAGLNRGLRDYHPAALEAESRAYQGLFARLQQIPSDSLGAVARIDHGVVSAQLRFLLHEFNDRRYYQRSLDSYVAEPFRGVDWQIQQMEVGADGQMGSEAEWNDLVMQVQAIPAYVETAKANLLAGRATGNMPDHRMVRRDGIQGSGSNAEYFRTTLQEDAKGYLGPRPFASKVATQLRDAGAAAGAAWEAFAEFLSSSFDLSGAADRFAMGDSEYQWRVTNCLLLPQTTQQLYEYGAEQVALYEEQVYDVAAQLAKQARLPVSFATEPERRAGVRAVMEFLSKDSPRDDAELLRWYQEAAERAVTYGRAQQLFDIPLDYRLDIYPTPPVLRNSIDAAYYPAPPFKRVGVGRFYLTPTGNDAGALRLNNRASVADTSVHEGFPGHDWHFKYMTAHAAQISNVRWLTPGGVEDSASMWEDAMAVEGWALYAEELMATPVSTLLESCCTRCRASCSARFACG